MVVVKQAKKRVNKQGHAFVVRLLKHLGINWHPSAFLQMIEIDLQKLQIIEQMPDFVFHYYVFVIIKSCLIFNNIISIS